jgi:mono/diheme cytochrome c family protein
MRVRQASGTLLLVIVCGAGLGGRLAQAQSQSGAVAADPYQRSADHFAFQATARNGPQHGEELYYYKCSFCHISFANRAPNLKDLLKRSNMTEQIVAGRIRTGGPGMPAYATTLSEADIADLVSYLKARCCWEGEDPPPNPRYRARTTR